MLINNKKYFDVLNEIKIRIKTAQYKAVLGANCEQILLYWNIGNIIIANTKYGAKFVENHSRDILSEFPDIQGFSIRNLKYMRKFAEIYPDFQKVQQGVALLPWRNNLTLLSKVNSDFVPAELVDTLPSAEDIEKRVKMKFDIEDTSIAQAKMLADDYAKTHKP